jgi:hypothetical protein
MPDFARFHPENCESENALNISAAQELTINMLRNAQRLLGCGQNIIQKKQRLVMRG